MNAKALDGLDCLRLIGMQLMELQAVLFDMDGVLADSEVLWNDIDATLLADYGVTYGGEHKPDVLGKSFPLALQFYKDTFNLRAEIETLVLRRSEIAADFYATRIPIFPAAPDVLAQLKAKGLRLGLASSSVGQLVRPFLDRHQLTRYFDAIIAGEEVERGKPFPDIYLRAASKVSIAPEHCLVVEDALSGIQAGKSAGMRVVAIPDPRFVDVSLYNGKADYIIEKLDDLPALIRDGLVS